MSEPATRFPVGRGDGGKRLDRFLHERIPGLSRSRIQRAIRERVSLSWGVAARPATPVRPGGEVRIGWTPLAETLADVPLPVLARGADWLAVDKPAGMPVHPVNRVRENSLIRMLRRQERDEALRLAHRLDRETTGVLLVAATSASARALSRAFREGTVDKLYVALVRGWVARERGRVAFPIARATGSRVWVRREAGQGEAAVTDWEVAERWADRTLVHLWPRTGRRHQLRVHMAAIGHPILGDLLYGRDDRDYLALVRGEGDARRQEGGPVRQLLHCRRLVFPDPGGCLRVTVESPLPPDFESACGAPD